MRSFVKAMGVVLAGLGSAHAAPEPSVRPGVNQQYVDRDLAVWQERFERAGREIFDRRADILRAIDARPGMAVADVGAGTGLFSFPLAEAVGPRGRVYAVDIVPKFIAHLEREARTRKLDNLTVVRGDVRDARLPPASVDLILLCDAYHHFEYPASMNRSIFRALRPGGTLVLIDLRREPGATKPEVLAHVRAGEEVVTRELRAAGFELVADGPRLELRENYLLRWRKPAKGPAPKP
jgi:predicted methyltransferase